MGKKKSAGAVDWTAPHPPAWGAINAAGVAASTACVGYLADAPLYTGAGVGTAGALAAVAVGIRRHYSRGHKVFRAASWLAAGGWASWAMYTGPWSSWLPFTTLTAGTVLGWGAAAAYAQYEAEAPARRAEAEAQARRDAAGGEWEERLARVCGVTGCQVIAIEEWEEGAGYTVEIALPVGGTTVDMISQRAAALRADLRLPLGCGLEITTGVDHGTVLIRVSTRNSIVEEFPYPDDISPSTINDTLEIGRFKDASPVRASLRFHCGLIIGQPEGGKTNLLNVINTGLMRCRDTLVWHIDITGAGISLPWLRAWAREGTADKPAVDWTAPTAEEAELMLRVALEIIAMRKKSYQDLMYSVDDDKVPVSPEIPEIIIMADEVASLPPRITELLSDVIGTGRASAVRVVSCALRGTRDMVTPQMREMTRLRIAMRVSDDSEYQHIFSEPRGIQKDDAPVQGSGFVEIDGERPRPFKAFRIKPSRILAISQTVAAYRPTLDPVSRMNIESARYYNERWHRTLPLLFPNIRLSPAAQKIVDSAPPAPVPNQPTGPAQGNTPNSTGIDMDALFPLGKGMTPPPTPAPPSTSPPPAPQPTAEEPPPPTPVTNADREERQKFAHVLDDAMWHLTDTNTTHLPLPQPPTLGPIPATATEITDPTQRRALELIDAAGAAGLGVSALERALKAEPDHGRDRSTLHRWLPRWAAYGHVVRVDRGGTQVVYVTPRHYRG
ncbi:MULTISPECIES: hypothetical protein [Streptomyces]|uniref:hypothetical protein n=1 Tax=Streptomyces TaxID=1883 RepID=UPI00163BF099|nr:MULTISPECIES: hypothetical protein [Streptomyces]MBC2879784.1 hypothetical protein [Streptomyces sp. TYQ1024]